MEEKLENFMRVIDRGFADLDAKLSELYSDTTPRQQWATERPELAQDFEPRESHNFDSHVASSSTPTSGVSGTANPDIQGEYQYIRDDLARVQLPAELRLNDSRQGIRRADQPVYNVIAKCGRYSETLA